MGLLKKAGILGFVSMSMTGCLNKVPAGNVGIKVYLLGTSKGVESEELGVGRYWIGFNEELYLFPTFKQNYSWQASQGFKFQTKEGMEVQADIGITYYLEQSKIHKIFQKYRRGIDEITDTFLRNHVRDALNSIASDMEVESVYGKGKSNFIVEVEKKVRSQIEAEGIIIEKLYIVGSFKLPKAVTSALNRKIEATQRAEQRENELREAEAEAKKKIAEADGKGKSLVKIAKADAESKLLKAEAEAKANQLVSKSLTEPLIKYKSIETWNGELPKVVSDKTMPMINLK